MSLLIFFNRLTDIFSLKTGKSRAAALFFPVLFFLVLLSGCGLPSYSYLYPPADVYSRDNPSSQTEQDLVFRNAYQNNISDFSGYEVYYKIYDPRTNQASYLGDITSMDKEGTDYNTLNNLGFHRLFFSNGAAPGTSSFSHSMAKPSFKPDPGLLNIDYFIRFNLIQNDEPGVQTYYVEPYSSSSGVVFSSVPYIYRWVYDKTGSQSDTTAKTLSSSSFDYRDSDMPASITAADADDSVELYITFYIMSFGRKASDITSYIYSEPVYLGTLRFDSIITDNFVY